MIRDRISAKTLRLGIGLKCQSLRLGIGLKCVNH